jgi:outer membrane protein assembly factor BamD (BamD/ComL family)
MLAQAAKIKLLLDCFYPLGGRLLSRFVGMRGGVILLSCCLTLPVIAADRIHNDAAPEQKVMLEKYYQQALYAYFQGDVLAALSQFSLLEQRYPQGLKNIPDYLRKQDIEPELLKGALSLSFGIEDQAAEIFQRLLADYDSAEKRTQAWFLLGLTYYRQEQWQKASRAFKQINEAQASDYLDVQRHDQWIYLQAQLRSLYPDLNGVQGNIAISESDKNYWQQALSADSIYHYYLQYNQALATLESGDVQLAIRQLEDLITQPKQGFSQFVNSWFSPLISESSLTSEEQEVAHQQEIYGVLDRAKLTLAYLLLQQDQPQQAYRVFSQIRREGLDGEAAVLGYGWAAAKSDELQNALGIWQSLIQQTHYSEYTLEAYLASAYAYEKAYAPRQSVAILKTGLRRFEQALVELSEARQQVSQPGFLLQLAQDFESSQPALISSTANVDQGGALKLLVNQLGVSNEFRHHLAALQQTQTLELRLTDWQQRMAYYELMLDEREQQKLQRAQVMLQSQIFAQLPALVEQRDALAQTLIMAEQQGNAEVLMAAQYQQWVERLDQAQQRLQKIETLKAQLQQPALKAEYAERLKRIKGTLVWLASEAYPDNRRQAQKTLAELDHVLDKANQQQKQLLIELQGRPDYATQRQQVSSIAVRIDQQLQKNQGLQRDLVTTLKHELTQLIDQQQGKVNDYILQAQLAMVRLNDQALQQNQAQGTQIPAIEIGRPPQLAPTVDEVQAQ